MGTSRKRRLRVFELQRLLKRGEKSATRKIEQRTNDERPNGKGREESEKIVVGDMGGVLLLIEKEKFDWKGGNISPR